MRCWSGSVDAALNDVTHSWAIENCKAALAVCKQTWVCGGISAGNIAFFFQRCSVQRFFFFFFFKKACLTTCFLFSTLSRCLPFKNGSARWRLTSSVVAF